MNIQTLFALGMKRVIPLLCPSPPPGHIVVNLGAGNQVIPGALALDYERGWDADLDRIPYNDGVVDFIHAYHFFEHVGDPAAVLFECQRVLKDGGVLTVGVPFYRSEMAIQDLDHKHFFTLNTWRHVLGNKYYDKFRREWTLEIHTQFVMFVEEANQMLFTQFIKRAKE